MNRKWYVVYTKTNAEKKTLFQLKGKNIESFLPLSPISETPFSKKGLTTGAPLFASLIFIKVDENELQAALKLDKVISILHWKSSPAIIPEDEVQAVKSFILQYGHVSAIPTAVNKHQLTELAITKGDEKAANTKVNKITLTLPSLGYVLTTEVAAQQINFITTMKPERLLTGINTSAF